MTAVVGLVTSALLIIMIVFALTGYAYKQRKICFKDRGVNPKIKQKKKPSGKVGVKSIYLL